MVSSTILYWRFQWQLYRSLINSIEIILQTVVQYLTSSDDILAKVKHYRNWITREKTTGVNKMHHDYIMRYVAETDEGNAKLRVRIVIIV
jgi:hypothetical protein